MKRHPILVFLLPVLAAPGCGGDGGPRLVKVAGTVTHNGKPFEGAKVEFAPDSSNRDAVLGTDVTGPAGNYLIRTLKGQTGLPPGKYTVNIAKVPDSPTSSSDATDQPTPDNDPAQKAALLAAGPKTKKSKGDDAAITGTFPATVESSGSSQLDFDVKSK